MKTEVAIYHFGGGVDRIDPLKQIIVDEGEISIHNGFSTYTYELSEIKAINIEIIDED